MSTTQEGPTSFTTSVVGTPAVIALATNGADGVKATSDIGAGILGTSNSGIGVIGESSSFVGVRGISESSIGVDGESKSGVGVLGESESASGVFGTSESGVGVFGTSKSGVGLHGKSISTNGVAGQFDGNVQVNGNLTVTGNKAFVQAHPTDPEREIVYVALEGGEAGTYVRGSGQLQSGKAVLALPEHFGLVTAAQGLTVQLTPRGEWLQLYVVELDTAQLVVREVQGKSGAFDYLIQGVRRGSESHEVIRTRR